MYSGNIKCPIAETFVELREMRRSNVTHSKRQKWTKTQHRVAGANITSNWEMKGK